VPYSLILSITFASTSIIGPIFRYYLAYVVPMNLALLLNLLMQGTLLHFIAAVSLVLSFYFALRSSKMHLKEYTKILKDEAYAQQMKGHYERLAGTDTLTGLPNRYRFFEVFDEMIKDAEKHKNKLALLFLDLDQFKVINDTYGHAAGDHLLKEIANRLVRFLGDRGFAARLTGDEFILLIRNPEEKEKILAMARELSASLQEPITVDSLSLTIRPSIGIVCYPFHGSNPNELLRAADAAMYQSKITGEPQWFHPESHTLHRPDSIGNRMTLSPGSGSAADSP
jgi:diguanylate cyclase (GGDEF)-like protein